MSTPMESRKSSNYNDINAEITGATRHFQRAARRLFHRNLKLSYSAAALIFQGLPLCKRYFQKLLPDFALFPRPGELDDFGCAG